MGAAMLRSHDLPCHAVETGSKTKTSGYFFLIGELIFNNNLNAFKDRPNVNYKVVNQCYAYAITLHYFNLF